MAHIRKSPLDQSDADQEAMELMKRLRELGYKAQAPTTTVTISLPLPLRNRVTSVSKRLNISVSEAMRQAVENWLHKVGVALFIAALSLVCLDDQVTSGLRTVTEILPFDVHHM